MGKQITPQQAEDLCNNYDAKHSDLTRVIGKDDTRSILFSLTELKNYINYLEKSKENVDGIRIYLASYNDNESKVTDNNLTTIFLAPTFQSNDNTKINAYNVGGIGKGKYKK